MEVSTQLSEERLSIQYRQAFVIRERSSCVTYWSWENVYSRRRNAKLYVDMPSRLHLSLANECQDYRWFPQGKVIFLGPTKPLVAQQIDACHQVCGIPGDDAIELTGQILPAVRAKKVRSCNFTIVTSPMYDAGFHTVGDETGLLYDSPNIHQ
jgi:hypothetical protein